MQATTPDQQDQAVRRIVGPASFERGQQYAASGAVLDPSWNPARRLAYGRVRGTAVHPYTATALLTCAPDGSVQAFRGACTCPVGLNCKHSVAVLLAARARAGQTALAAPTGTRPAPASDLCAASGWERALAVLTGTGSVRRCAAPAPAVALQFELRPQPTSGGAAPAEVILRPVLRGHRGNWVRTGISWSGLDALRYTRPAVPPDHQRLLAEIVALHAGLHRHTYYGYRDPVIELAQFGSRRIWDLLAEAQDAGLPLIRAGADAGPVTVHSRPVELTLQVRADGDGLVIAPALCDQGVPVDPATAFLLGRPAHGLGWWAGGDRVDAAPALRLAPLAGTGGRDVRTTLAGAPVRIPATDRDRFLREFYPRLRRLVPIVSADETVSLPEVGPPVLALSVATEPEHRLRLRWDWCYPLGAGELLEPLWPAADQLGGYQPAADQLGARDAGAEQLILARLGAALGPAAGPLAAGPDGRWPAASQRLAGMDTVRFLTELMPALAAIPGVRVSVTGERSDYRAAESAPVIAFGGPGSAPGDGSAEPVDRDWFDLAVTVSVDGESVGFEALFVALAAGQPYLILASGTYFSLDRPEFAQLAALIGESRDLYDAPPGTVRLSKFQASMWDELDRLGVVSAQAAAWQQAARALCTLTALDPVPLPAGLRATLRPYQKDGLDWLACLFGHGLGGVLADEMGLGKTVQTLALFCHARERCDTTAPFLVVAPTSVVHNWAAECARFAPGLDVRTVTETAPRRGVALAEAVAGAEVVVTSYTLFRLEYDDYAALDWAGLVLDEAQFVKNHQAKGYQCAKKLPAPFKLAITGTPMENNLMELWALLSVTAPGLFPSPHRFAEFYRAPIEREHDADRLDQLRRRTRPLMLRRTKAQVITDLPDKQEQVIELELNARHRKVYQTHLQRERQKVLGLLGDLDNNRFEIFRSLTLLRQASLHAALIDPSYAKIPSTKLDALLQQLGEIVAGGHRVVVFSQFTRFLAAARERLDAAGIEHCYLDGKTRKRAQVLESFKSGSAPVFLISLKAGGVGLNLTEADYCIILDPWWNPAVEAQAVDRLHRIGQRRTVMVYRLVAAETIEQKVMALKAEKAALFDSVVNGGAAGSAALTAADIRALVA